MTFQPARHKIYLTQIARMHRQVTDLENLLEKIKQEEDELEQEIEQWEIIFDALPAMISIHDRDYNLIKINKAFANALLKLPEELVGKKCYEVIHGTNESFSHCPHREVLKTGKPVKLEFYEPRLEAYLQIWVSPIFNKKHEVIGTIHIVYDITEAKREEEAKEDLIKMLKEPRLKVLSGVLPICAHCYKIRDEQGNWSQFEKYIKEHSEADFAHTFCPDCAKTKFPEFEKSGS